jgi:hypothetical protein
MRLLLPLIDILGAASQAAINTLTAAVAAAAAAAAAAGAEAATAQTGANTANAALSLIRKGFATVPNGATIVVVAVGAECNGKPVCVTPLVAMTAARFFWAECSGGNLSLSIDVDNTADLTFSYQIDAR